ncbi:hypothetical protein Fcan01_28283 [Folsomia candida]|uniref:Uncharacterized protein n=1 Tax=Folsomia candida TaxID=158441 RepID=A0A226CX11_FOLCA|nr:hypothetical protein Fcan01_28283 [Folsomia candida]
MNKVHMDLIKQDFTVIQTVQLILMYGLTGSVSSSFLSIPNYLGDCNIQFMQRENIGEDQPAYCELILARNPTSPFSLNQIRVSKTYTSLPGWTNSLINRQARSYQISVAFIHVNANLLNGIPGGLPVSYLLQQHILYYYNPTYLFQHSYKPKNPKHFKNYAIHLGTSKLILFNFYSPDELYIPCLACYDSPPNPIETIPLSKLEIDWWSHNRNLQQRLVNGQYYDDTKAINCGVNYVGADKQTLPDYCKCILLSQNLNFSVSNGNNNPVSFLGFGYILSDIILRRIVQPPYKFIPSIVQFQPVKFTVIAKYPSAMEGMNAFLLPFSYNVWGVLLLNCFTLCVIAQLGNAERNLIQIVKKISENIINIIAILLGQVSGQSLQVFAGLSFGAPFIWLFFGRYIIMDNLYTRSIFSYLSAIKAPVVPETLSELLDSSIPIITRGVYISNRGSYESTLKTNIIPGYVASFKSMDATKSVEMYLALNDRLVYAYSHSKRTYQNLLTSLLESKSLNEFDLPIDSRQMYAILDIKDELNVLTTLFRRNQTRLVIDARDDIPFVAVSVDRIFRNYLCPLFSRKFGQLATAGIEFRWAKLLNLAVAISNLILLGTLGIKGMQYSMRRRKNIRKHQAVRKNQLGSKWLNPFLWYTYYCFCLH